MIGLFMQRPKIFLLVLGLAVLLIGGVVIFGFLKNPFLRKSLPQISSVTPKPSSALQQLLISTLRHSVSTDSAVIALAEKVATQLVSKIRLDPCDNKPFFIRVKKGSTITFIKEDGLDHTLEFDRKRYTLASTSSELQIDQLSTPNGVFTVKCDFNGRRGIIYIK